MSDDRAAAADRPTRVKLTWVTILYVAQGFPFGIINYLLPVWLRTAGASLPVIGRMVSDVGAAWTFKFLWAPLVDRFGTRKAWIVPCQLALGAITLALAAADPSHATRYLWGLLVTLAALSATQDIAIDAYTIELLDRREMGVANGVRVTAYRVALLLASGVLVWLAGRMGWPAVFAVGAALMGALAALTLTIPSTAGAGAGERREFLEPLRALLRRPRAWAVVLFALTFKLGDYAMQPMTLPFAVDRGLTVSQIGALNSIVIAAVIAGALVGGVLTTRWGVFRALWALGLVQALSNLGYFAAALPGVPKEAVFGAGVVEQFTGGLGTAAFLAFLMSVCDKRYAATQYAFLSALFGATRWLGGRQSGELAQSLGYARFFLLTFFLALPAFALLPLVRGAERAAEE